MTINPSVDEADNRNCTANVSASNYRCQQTKSRSIRRQVNCLAVLACAAFLCCGCSRSFWRSQADFDAYNLLSQKQFDSHWVIPRTSIEPDQRSRFYDPFDRDLPPLPPDDPAASRYMEWVNGIRGYKSWHKFGRSISVENPQWLANFGIAPDSFHDSYQLSDGITDGDDPTKLPTGDTSRLVPTIENLTLAQTIELASIHSRDYQTQLENLYSSALQLSLDQFQFQVRYLVGKGPTGPSTALPSTSVPTGILNNTTVPGTSNALGLASAGGMSQILPTGGQWIVGLANNTLWLFSGGQQTTSQSLLSYSLVQPLLSGAGRKFFLENLTFSERNVLYNTRILARYRRLFFADAVVNTGGGSVSSPVAISATSSSSVSNPAVISTNASVNVAAGTTAGTTAASSSAQYGGFFGLLYQLQLVLNQHENVENFRIQSQRMKELVAQTPFRRLDAGSLPDGIQFPQKLARRIEYLPSSRRIRWKDSEVMSDTERDELLALSNDSKYRAAINEIYTQLRVGVTTLDLLQVDTTLTNSIIAERRAKFAYDDEIDQFKMFLGLPTDMQITVDRSLLKQFELTDPRLLSIEKRLLGFVTRAFGLDVNDPPIEDLKFIVDRMSKMTDLVRTDAIDLVAADVEKVKEQMPRRLEKLLWDESRETVTARFERDTLIFKNVYETFEEIARQVTLWQRQIEDSDPGIEARRQILSDVKDAREDLLLILQNLRVLQAGLRAELIELIDFNMSLEEATETALQNRLDLMNSRARVMDVRRNMEVAANRLEAILNLVAQGSLNTPAGANHPLDFRGASSNFQIGLQMTTPLDQVQVRNAYRSSLISYQQARRAYMLLEDQVKYDIRTSWRQLRMNAQIFEVSRKALRQAALQLDINVANNMNPKAQVAGQGGTTNLGITGLNLINAVNAVLTSHNNLINIWVLYERNRINIYRDMDIMEVDERGVWTDPFYRNLGHEDSPTYSNEPAHDIPPEPAGSVTKQSRPAKRSPYPGIVRLGAFSQDSSAETDVGQKDRARGLGRGGRARVAVSDLTLVSGRRNVDADDGPDGRADHGDGEEGDLPDHGR